MYKTAFEMFKIGLIKTQASNPQEELPVKAIHKFTQKAKHRKMYLFVRITKEMGIKNEILFLAPQIGEEADMIVVW